MTAKLKSDVLRVVKRLRCYGTDAEDNFGCGDKRCKYRDVDGACNINSLEADVPASYRRSSQVAANRKNN